MMEARPGDIFDVFQNSTLVRKDAAIMMTLANLLLALASLFVWRRNASWGLAAIIAVLAIGVVIFVRDVDFASNLGIQL